MDQQYEHNQKKDLHYSPNSTNPIPLTKILSFEEMRSLTTLDDCNLIYQKKGVTFENQQKLLTQLRYDWEKAKEVAKKQAKESALPIKFPTYSITLQGVSVTLYGICHSKHSSDYHNKLFEKAIEGKQPLLYEENLSQYVPKNTSAIEMHDHSMISLSNYLKGGFSTVFKEITSFVLTPIILPLAAITKSKTPREKDKNRIYELSIRCLVNPPELIRTCDYPTLFSLNQDMESEYFEVSRSRYIVAFIDEYIRTFSPQQVHCMMGLAHVSDVLYYTTHIEKIKRKESAKAKKHVSLLSKSQKAYNFSKNIRDDLLSLLFTTLVAACPMSMYFFYKLTDTYSEKQINEITETQLNIMEQAVKKAKILHDQKKAVLLYYEIQKHGSISKQTQLESDIGMADWYHRIDSFKEKDEQVIQTKVEKLKNVQRITTNEEIESLIRDLVEFKKS